jgi:hypothetical protein
MPHLKHLKTYVPVFPWMYGSLDAGYDIGNQKNVCLYGERSVRV